MLGIIRRSVLTKILSVLLLVSFLATLMEPVPVYGLTGGPSQPEMAGFTPANTDSMVDLFSGDFHYTIPIMTVPGPDGGFPVSLNYNSNVGMEYEASWVGLGWSLNAGAINRQVRGIPDDFAGEKINKQYLCRDNNTFLFTLGGGGEVYGADFGIGLSNTNSLIYNTYHGITLSRRFGIAASYVRNGNILKERCKYATANFGLDLNSDNGITQSFAINGGYKNLHVGAQYGYNSKNGTYTFSDQISLNFSQTVGVEPRQAKSDNDKLKEPRTEISLGGGGHVGSSFSNAATLPSIQFPTITVGNALSFQIGGSGAYLEGFGTVNCQVISQKTKSEVIGTPSYGILYAEQAGEDALQDFNREKDICIDKHSRNLPLPVMTHDLYCVSGELMSGTFRAFRSDYGHFHDNKVETKTVILDEGADVGFGIGVQIGASVAANYGESSSSDWSGGSFDRNISFKGKEGYNSAPTHPIPPTLYEPFYFKMTGEQTASEVGWLQPVGGERAVNFPLNQQMHYTFWDGLRYDYSISNSLSSGTMSRYVLAERSKRTHNIEYKKAATATHGRKGNHVGEFSIVNANGQRFTYGKALYNMSEKDVQFSIPYTSGISSAVTSNYSEANAKGTTRVGKQRLYSCTETPAYAYSYLLTQITAPDYVDANNDGIADDGDLGYWVSFKYKDAYSADQGKLYSWRFPYSGANFFMGDRSNQTDDKASYNYGTKEISYLETIETQTHIAVFHVSERCDAFGVASDWKGGRSSNQPLYKLDSIQLFCKGDQKTLIKTAVFEYTYELCKNIPNSSDNQGKLTLKKVYFKYANSAKGKESPYVFTYSAFNPDYNATMMDRWGQYKGNANYFEHYTSQDKATADLWTSAWLLTRIDLPEGGSILVDYESDDYAYVQDRQAMYMAQVSPQTSFNKESDGKYYIYFEKQPAYPASRYVTGFKNNLMAFKIADSYDNSMLPDYVQGYVKVNPQNATDVSPTVGKVEVERYPAYDIHPVYFIVLQYLKNNRPDLLFNNSDAAEDQSDAEAFFRALVSGGIIDKAMAMNSNSRFYQHCVASHDYRHPRFSETGMPSYVRLNVPSKTKYGGGSRVKAITLRDNWEKSTASEYKQEYFYKKTENGQLVSSGVAEYEPMMGAEENALRYPVYDVVTGLFFVEDEMYSEEPYGENYFPSANVGYSQVIVKAYTPAGVELSTAGIQRHEFYTAKDFPIIVSQTPISVKTNPMPNLLSLLTAGFKQENTAAFSQGYAIQLNDMHGKMKSVGTHPYIATRDEAALVAAVETSGATSKVEYVYRTKRENGVTKVDNCVDVLTNDGKSAKRILGQTCDFVIDQRENFSKSIGGGASAQFMLATYYPPLVGVSAMPSFDCFEETIRSVAVTKVIYNTGILDKTIAHNNGSVITTQNVQYDPYTGQPLLTTVTNEFEQPVYSYTMPAYWYYPNMGSASENYRATYYGNPTLPNGYPAFDRFDVIGDNPPMPIEAILSNADANCWRNTSSSAITTVSLKNKEIIRSRFSNQLSTTASSISSLTNPASPDNRRLPVLEQFNTKPAECFKYKDCAGNMHYAVIVYDSTKNDLHFFTDDDNEKLCSMKLCELLQNIRGHLVFQNIRLPAGADITDYEFIRSGWTIRVKERQSQRVAASFEWNDPDGWFPECIDGVLQASAVEYKNDWPSDSALYANTYPEYQCVPNIYRSLRSNLYVTERKQTGSCPQYSTNVAYDGTFSSFMVFNHSRGNAGNMQSPWTWTAEVTKYSPFNFEIENVSPLGVYSAALYGYKNSLATAVAANARHCEIGFNGFENDLEGTFTQRDCGHIKCDNGIITKGIAHTGSHSYKASSSLKVNATVVDDLRQADYNSGGLYLQSGKEYVFSCWVRKADCLTLENLGNDFSLRTDTVTCSIRKEEKVDCWQRSEVVFKAGAATASTTIELLPHFSGAFYVDDIRIMPFNATFKSYVYDADSYRLLAELDENNYATLYNYDEEGILVQIKKETAKGIRTIKTTRQNLKRNTSIQ